MRSKSIKTNVTEPAPSGMLRFTAARAALLICMLVVTILPEAICQNVTGYNYGGYSSVNGGALNYGNISNPFTVTYAGASWSTKALTSYAPVTTPSVLSGYTQPDQMLELGAFLGAPAVAQYTFDMPLPATSVLFIQDIDALESFRIEFLDASGSILNPGSIGVYHLSNPAVSTATIGTTSITVTANDDINYGESLSTFEILNGSVSQVRITQIASRNTLRNSGTAEFYFAVPSPPTADDESSYGNISGSVVTMDLLSGDLLGNGSQGGAASVTITFPTPSNGTVSGNTITVPGQGQWTYVPSTGLITFAPESGFTGDPTPISYSLTDNATGLSDNALITVTYGSMPVRLASFSASLSEGRVQLSWTTAEERSADYFQAERSIDAKHWEVIGAQKAFGESTIKRQYEFADQAPLAGNAYYRLKMIDVDGSFSYSAIRVVSRLSASEKLIYPSPASDRVFIAGLNLSKITSWSITSPAGMVIRSGDSLQSPKIDLKNIDSGLYLLKIDFDDASTYIERVLVSR